MKLLGKDISPAKVMALVTERLAARGLTTQDTEFHEAGEGVVASSKWRTPQLRSRGPR